MVEQGRVRISPGRYRVMIDGVDPAEVESVARRRAVVLSQDYVRYHLSARENIWHGEVVEAGAHTELMARGGQA